MFFVIHCLVLLGFDSKKLYENENQTHRLATEKVNLLDSNNQDVILVKSGGSGPNAPLKVSNSMKSLKIK